MARELFAEGKVGSTITKVTIAAAMDGVESRGDIVFGEESNRILGGGFGRRELQRCRFGILVHTGHELPPTDKGPETCRHSIM